MKGRCYCESSSSIAEISTRQYAAKADTDKSCTAAHAADTSPASADDTCTAAARLKQLLDM
jgi:hypothetical protein